MLFKKSRYKKTAVLVKQCHEKKLFLQNTFFLSILYDKQGSLSKFLNLEISFLENFKSSPKKAEFFHAQNSPNYLRLHFSIL